MMSCLESLLLNSCFAEESLYVWTEEVVYDHCIDCHAYDMRNNSSR